MKKLTDLLYELVYDIEEGGEWKIVVRKGKKKRILDCPVGMKAVGKKCKKMSVVND